MAPRTQIAQVPARAMYDCLVAPGALHKGAAINVYVPGLAPHFTAPGRAAHRGAAQALRGGHRHLTEGGEGVRARCVRARRNCVRVVC